MSSKDLIEYIVSRILFLVESDGKSSQNESRYAWLCSKELKSKTDVTCHDMNRLSRILDKISINQQIDGLFRLENFYNEYGKLSFAVAVDTFEEIHISNIMIKKIGYQRAQNISSVGKNKGVLQVKIYCHEEILEKYVY